MFVGAIIYKRTFSLYVVNLIILTFWSSLCRLWSIYQRGQRVIKASSCVKTRRSQSAEQINKKKDLLTPSNQVVVFHSYAVSAEHTNDHDIKMEPFYTHPRESRWEQIVQAYCYNTANDLEKYIFRTQISEVCTIQTSAIKYSEK